MIIDFEDPEKEKAIMPFIQRSKSYENEMGKWHKKEEGGNLELEKRF